MAYETSAVSYRIGESTAVNTMLVPSSCSDVNAFIASKWRGVLPEDVTVVKVEEAV